MQTMTVQQTHNPIFAGMPAFGHTGYAMVGNDPGLDSPAKAAPGKKKAAAKKAAPKKKK